MTELNIKVPLSSIRANYDPEAAKSRYEANKRLIADKYHYDKMLGKRRKDGALKLQELKPEHKQYVSCFIHGMKGVEIAEQFNVAAITVYRVLADPLATSLIGEFDESFKKEFKSMFPLVADAVRSGLGSGSEKTRLQAVDRWTKVCRFIDGDPEEKDQEEKTVAVRAARLRFVDLVKNATKGQKLIEAEFVEVTTS